MPIWVLAPEVWLFLSLLGCVTLFFKFSRFWSVRNLDLLLLFVLAPGMMLIVGNPGHHSWSAYIWLFLGSGLWLVRCLLDLGLVRRPLLEPNLNASGLLCLSVGILGLLLAETVSLPVEDGAARNPAEPSGREDRSPRPRLAIRTRRSTQVIDIAPCHPLKRKKPQVIVSRVLASLAHCGLVVSLLAIGWRHFERPITGMAMAACYLLLPYTRMALVDSGQLIPAALIVAAVFWHLRPALAGALIGLAAGWIPACLGLIALWCGFFRGRGAVRFTAVAVGVVVGCAPARATWFPSSAIWARDLGARSIAEVGLLPQFEPQSTASFWMSIDSSFRLPVLIAYLALVIFTMIWPAEKNLAELIALSAALLVASQFWYLDKGGTLVMLYLPLAIAMMFRPTLDDPQAAGTVLPAPRQPAFSSSFCREIEALERSSTVDPSSTIDDKPTPRSDTPMSFVLTYDAIAKRIDHSLLGPTLSARSSRKAAGWQPGTAWPAFASSRTPCHGRADPARVGRRRGNDHRVSRTAVMPRR